MCKHAEMKELNQTDIDMTIWITETFFIAVFLLSFKLNLMFFFNIVLF